MGREDTMTATTTRMKKRIARYPYVSKAFETTGTISTEPGYELI
jgi:hypothetical protein